MGRRLTFAFSFVVVSDACNIEGIGRPRLFLRTGYDVGEYSDQRWGERYGEGKFVGKRVMLAVTLSERKEHYGDRGINGPLNYLLFPIHHGVLFYPGFSVLPPLAVHRSHKMYPEKLA